MTDDQIEAVWNAVDASDLDVHDRKLAMKLRCRFARAIEQASRRAALEEWQPIDTAPKDGTVLILFARAKHATASAPVFGWWLPDLGWVESAFSPNHPAGIVPSHWMPRPEFPSGGPTSP